MKQFAFGTPEQFTDLFQTLPREGGYRFADQSLPPCCTRDTADLYFAREGGRCRLYIDGGIDAPSAPPAFRDLLARGQADFASPEELMDFFRALRPLFAEAPEEAATFVVDKEKLRLIQSAQQAPKLVRPAQLAAPLKEKVFGQDPAIDELCKKVAVQRLQKERRLLTVALLGPTATGKSETAKSLARVMSGAYGEPYDYLEIAGSELLGEQSVHRFFGAPAGYVGHGEATLLEPVRKQPRQVIVINEIEKANEKVLVGLMEAIDTGRVGMADNSPAIDLNQCVLLLTSNLPIDMDRYAAASSFERAELCRDAFTKHCGRPEISGKIGNFVVFQPLSQDAIVDIAVKFIQEELDNYHMTLLRVDEGLMADILRCQTRYGARAIRDLVRDAVGQRLLNEEDPERLRHRLVELSGTLSGLEIKSWNEKKEDLR